MKPYLIKFWHGRPPGDNHFMRKVRTLFRHRPEDDQFFWDGSLEDFAKKWGDKFIYMPPPERDFEYIMGTLAITHCSGLGWGAR